MSDLLWLSPLAVIVLLVGVYLLHRRVEKRRTDALRRQAMLLGFSFEERQDLDRQDYSKLHFFNRGHSREIRNVLAQRGTEGAEKLVFDYRYIVRAGKSTHTHRHTVAVLRFPERTLPGFRLGPENLFHKIGTVFGFQDIDFPEDPEFSRRYLLQGENEEAVRRVFRFHVRQALRNEQSQWRLEGGGPWLLFLRRSRREKPEHLREFIHKVDELAEALTASC